MKKIYLVLTNTGTPFSKIIRKYTRDTYNHVSVGLNPDLLELYSFGRRNPYICWYGGFVVEGRDHGTFKRFKKTEARVYELEVNDQTYAKAEDLIRYFVANRKRYHYNHRGIIKARKNVYYQRNERCFYCSQFVHYFLVSVGVVAKDAFEGVVTPSKLSLIPDLHLIYEGLLREYRPSDHSKDNN